MKKITNQEIINAVLNSHNQTMLLRNIKKCMNQYECDAYDAIYRYYGAYYYAYDITMLTRSFNNQCKKYMHTQNLRKRKMKHGNKV